LAASAETTPAPAQPVKAAQETNPVVCHYFYHQGELIRRPLCLTAHQWEHERLYQQRLFREYQMRALVEHM
jgi:hypothetical protein